MVRVESLTEKEISLREKTSRLVEITEKALGPTGKSRILLSDPRMGTFHLKHHSTEALDLPIGVNVESNRIFVYHPSYFDEAMRLAEAYEADTKEEFTVKRNYQ